MDYNAKRQFFAWICLIALISSNFGECDPLPRRSGGHSGGSFGSRVRSSLFGHSSGAKSSFSGSYPRQGGLSSGSYPKQSGISSSYPRQSSASHPGYTPFSSNPYSSRGNTGFSGSYPRQGGVGNTYNTYNRPAYSSSSYGGSRSGLGGGLLGGGLGGSSYARPSTSRIGGRDMLKIGAGVAGGYLAGKAISNMFSGGRYPNGYWRDQDRYYYDQQQDRYYDSRRQQYTQAPPCDKPAAGANTTDWQMYSECLEYFNAYRNQYQQQGGGGGYGGGGYYGAAVISASASSTLVAVLLATVLSYGYVAGVFGRRNIVLTNANTNNLLCS